MEKYNLTANEYKSKLSEATINLLGNTIENEVMKSDPEHLKPLLDLPPPIDQSSLRRTIGMFSHYAKWIHKCFEKIQSLIQVRTLPVQSNVVKVFEQLKSDLTKFMVTAIEGKTPFTEETDASNFATAATLSQNERPVAFYFRTLSTRLRRHASIVEMEELLNWTILSLDNRSKVCFLHVR